MQIAQDVRFAIRMLAKDRRFTMAAVVALGLGIGVNTSVFGVINAAVIRDMPFDEPDRLVSVRSRNARGEESGLSYPDFRDWREATTTFAGLAADAGATMNLREEGRAPERFRGTYVSANAFGLLRTKPIAGRDFLPEDDRPGAPPVVMLGYGVWHSRYGGDPAVIGRAVRVNDMLATVIGVMPAGFKYPFLSEVWQPLALWPGAANARRDVRALGVVGRLGDGIDLPQARADLDTIAGRLTREYPGTNTGIGAVAKRLKDSRPPVPKGLMTALMGAVGFVLLIAYANLANLLLARSVNRSREIAIRTSLGATRWRIVRQLLIECGLLAMLGGVLGLVLSVFGVNQMAVAFDIIEPGAPAGSTRAYWYDVSPDAMVYGFVGALSIVSALAFGLIPAWHISKTNAYETLKDTGRSGAGGVRARRWTSALLTAELALTLILLTSAGLLWRSFVTQYRADVVIDPSNLVTMRLALPQQQYRTPEERKRFFERLDERLQSISAFSSVTLATHAPLEFGGPPRELSIDGVTRAPDEKPPVVTYVLTSATYFDTLKLPIVRGRGFTSVDAAIGQEGAIVDQRFAARFFSNEDPIGRRIQLTASAPPRGPSPADPPRAPGQRLAEAQSAKAGRRFTIIGVAPTVPQSGPSELIRPVVYAPLHAEPAPDARAVVIVKGSASARATADKSGSGTATPDRDLALMTSVLREEVRALDPSLPLFGIETLETAVARSRMPVRLVGTWFGVLAIVALVLASVGLYALTAHGVAQRTHEIGVRMALGAEARAVTWLFMRRTFVQLAIGLALGLAGALSVGQLLHAFLQGTSPRDPITVAMVTVVLVVVAGAATLFPARRAARVDPMTALRTE